MYKAFKYKLYPTRQQEVAMLAMLETHRRLYNNALAERKQAWDEERRNVTYFQQSAQLKDLRKVNPYLNTTNFSSCEMTLRRLDRAFQAFFRRVKSGEARGYPRFKGRNRFNTIGFKQSNGCRFDGTHVYFQHIGRVKVKCHRPIEGVIKTLSFQREADGWHLILACEIEKAPAPAPVHSGPSVGIDLGLKSFLMTSDGASIAPPQHQRKAQAALRRAQRKVARRQKSSKRRAKAVDALRKQYQHVANQRRDFHHKTARALVTRYGAIAHEELNIQGIARSRLAKSTHDAGWGLFLSILSHKAEEAGVAMVAVPPRNTTQMCSQCGALPDIPKTLSDRVHHCSFCGYTADRDVNAALNILRLGLSRQDVTTANGRACPEKPSLAE